MYISKKAMLFLKLIIFTFGLFMFTMGANSSAHFSKFIEVSLLLITVMLGMGMRNVMENDKKEADKF
jgi:hypothetical protein